MEGKQNKLGRRLLLFPYPLQGHVTPMLHLATLLYSKGFSVTIIHTRYKSPDPTNFPHLNFQFIDDGLSNNFTCPPPNSFSSLLSTLNTSCLEPFRLCLSRMLGHDDHGPSGDDKQVQQEPVACLIADPLWGFCEAMANCFNLPRIALRTGSMSAFVVYHSIPLLRDKGYFPLQDKNLDEPLPEHPPLKLEDLPAESQHGSLASRVKEFKTSLGIICNTFEELESSALANARQALSIPIFPIGPLCKYSPTCASSSSIQEQDTTCISWLNTQSPKSVLYVSFGSVAAMTEAEFQEIAWGLANSMQPFLWVVRPGLVHGSEKKNNPFPEDYLDIVVHRGRVVKWAPQQEVLAHPSVGGFWTHCGWNSTVESISEGVPMICQPFLADQAMNMRHVTENWRVGLKLEKGMKRDDITRVIRRLMVEEEGEEMRKRAATLKEKVGLGLMEGGSSYKSLESLISYLLSF